MNESKIVVRYAKALYSLAEEKNALDIIHKDMQLLWQLRNDVPGFDQILENPVLQISVKLDFFKAVFEKALHPISIQFSYLAIQNKRAEYITDMARMFCEIYKKKNNYIDVVMTTAVKIDSKLTESIHNSIKILYNASNIVISEKINPEILGGFILDIDDKQYDASVSSNLNKLQQQLLNSNIN